MLGLLTHKVVCTPARDGCGCDAYDTHTLTHTTPMTHTYAYTQLAFAECPKHLMQVEILKSHLYCQFL